MALSPFLSLSLSSRIEAWRWTERSDDEWEEFSYSLDVESLVEEVKDQAAATADDAKDKVAELAADAKEKGQGTVVLCEKTFP